MLKSTKPQHAPFTCLSTMDNTSSIHSNQRPRLIVISGASAGIGACLVRHLLAIDHSCVLDTTKSLRQIVGLARRIDRLESLRDSLPKEQINRFHPLQCDVTDPVAVAQSFDKISNEWGIVEVLINCAGCLRSGQLCTLPAATVQEVLLTNVMSVVNCTRHAVATMRSENHGYGQIVLVNSVFGHHVAAIPGHLPSLNIYPATKFALTAMNEIYRQEFKELRTKIRVTSISPGLVDTEFISAQQKSVCNGKILQPEDVVSAILFVLSAPPHVQIHELTVKPLGEMI